MLRLALCLLLQCLAAAQASTQDDTYPPLDGMGNNKAHPDWGRANMPYLEQQVPFRANDTNSLGLTGANRPSAREISLALTNSPYFKASNKYNTSYLLSALGQIITKDISYAWNDRPSPDSTSAPIPIPRGDPLFSNFKQQRPVTQGSRTMLEFNRTHAILNNATGQRQPLNIASSFLDASMLYGTDANTSRTLRAGTAGRLLDDGDRMLPYNYNPTTGGVLLQMSNIAGRVSNTELRMSGHPHVNQNPFPLVMNTLLLREHNRRAQQAENQHPDWTDEQLFQTARKWVIAHMQRIAFVDYMVELGIPLPPYTGYNASVNPTVDLFFGTVAYRYGHATLTDVILRLDENWGEHAKGHLQLMQTYYNPDEVLSAGIEPIIRGLIAMPQGEVETRWSSAVAGNLWGFSTVNGTDLVALNIQRGRDHGIPDYNTCRRALGLKPIKTFAQLTPDHDLAVTLEVLYKDINNVDAYIGGLAEPHYQKAHVGELFYFSILDQFKRLRDGDWWYYENKDNGLFSRAEIAEVQRTSLRDIIQRNTNITNLPDNIFSAVGLQGNCAASGGSSGGQEQLLLSNLMNGKGQMQVRRADTNGWVRVQVTSPGDGWLGFGVAKPGSSFPMIGADLVIGHLVNGAPVVKRYTAPAHAPPVEAPDAGQLKVIGFTQANGQTTLEFERPLAASSNAAADGSIAMPLDSPVVLLMARGPGEDVSGMAGYHGVSDRDYKTVNQLFSGADASSAAAAASDAITKRKAHGILMAVNFIIVLPLGALAARQLRSHWLRNSGFRASLFYVHVATQVAGVIMATVGFVIATRFFGTKYYRVAFHHGQIGIAILTLVYSQLLMGFVRPSASSTTSVIRRVWDYAHSLLGRSAMLLGVLNVIVGVFIFSMSYGGDLVVWGGLCAAGLLAIQLVQYTLDRHEKNTILAIESSNLQQRLEADLPDSADDFPGSHHSGMHKDISPDAMADLPASEQPVLYDADTKPSGFRDNKPNGRSFVSMIMGQQAPAKHRSFSGMPAFSSNLPYSGNSNGEMRSEPSSGQQGEGFMGRLTESILKRHEQSVPPPGADNIDADPVVAAKPWSKTGEA